MAAKKTAKKSKLKSKNLAKATTLKKIEPLRRTRS